MLNKEEIEKAKEKTKKWIYNMRTGRRVNIIHKGDKDFCNDLEKLLQYIDQLEQENKKLTHTNKSYKGMINKQNKINNEMIDSFYKLYQKIPGTMHKFFENGKPCEYGYDKETNDCKEINCKPCIKQYFVEKVEEK